MNYYSPHTGEFIETSSPASWMGKTESAPPPFDRATHGCFFRDDAWEIVDADPVPNPRIAEIKAELDALDFKKIRPLAAGDTEYLAILQAKTTLLQDELKILSEVQGA